MAMYLKVNGNHKKASDMKVNVGGLWKQAKSAYTKVSGAWKEFWRSSTVVSVTKTGDFSISISGFPNSVSIKNVKLRLYNKNTNELVGENNVGDTTVTRSSRPILSVSRSSTDWSASFTPQIDNGKLIIYTTLTGQVYAEFEYDEVVNNN